ncbi:hypothetical protein F4779DRAFT_619969 [Xylariaceae sp. FL0662B]|nr:hypothetical protein F4779DRAFT_619969 [Xylariaceae sp. FL0662B]
MDDFPRTLIIALVVSAIVVVVLTGLIYYLALNWARIARRIAPESWTTPPSEKARWPQSRESIETSTPSPASSPGSSPRWSKMSTDPMLKTGILQTNETRTTIIGGCIYRCWASYHTR